MSNDCAKYYKCALQVNPYNYSKYRGDKVEEEDEYNNEILKECQKNNISVVGIADHGNIDNSISLKEKLEEKDIVVFPGFEVMSAEKIHMVCLFSPKTDSSTLNRVLGAVGLEKALQGNETSTKTCMDIADEVKKQGGFWYAAHITGDNGILKIGKLNNVWKDERLIAAQIPNSKDKIDSKYKNIIKNKDPQYKRRKLPAFINACDIEKPEDLEKDTAVTLIKMSQINFDSFIIAFKDPDSRVKLISELEKNYQSCITHMQISGGYLDGMSVDFSDNLTTIIGGRGTGKSTIINLIRYTLDLSIEKDQEKSFSSMIETNLGSAGKVELTIKSNNQYGKLFTIIRRFKSNPVIKDNNGEVSNLKISDILPNIEIYGQNEIMDIVDDNQKIAKVVKRLFPVDEEVQRKKQEAYNKLVENGKKLDAEEENLNAYNESISDLPAIQEKMKFYREAGLDNKLCLIQKFSKEEGQFESIDKEIPNQDDEIEINPISIIDSENKYLKEFNSDIKVFNSEINEIKRKYTCAVKKLRDSYYKNKEDWEAKKESCDQEIKQSLKQIDNIQDKTSNEIASDYSKAVKKIEKAKPFQSHVAKANETIKKLNSERQNLIENYRECCDESDQKISRILKRINSKKLKNKMELSIKFRQQKQKLVSLLKEINGIGDRSIAGIMQYKDFDVFTFVEDINKKNELKEKYSLTDITAKKLINNLSKKKLRDIQQLQLSNMVEIKLKVNSEFKKLESLSKGQQCTAILNILLLDNKDPLIVDQPEDNLDNAFIANNLVETIRNNKVGRQYIFATHNANIPVFGDAELIITMEEENGQGVAVDNGIGSIDSEKVRQHVIQILEGGTEAFRMREEKYGIK